MNNRVEELAKQAGYYQYSDGRFSQHYALEKFAELLIYECAKVADAAIDHRHGCVSWPSSCIIEHFKVDTE